FFVLFSSAVSILGGAGLGNHAAACGFLDGLAQYRRASGLAALGINWGPWSEIGTVARRNVGERFQSKGLLSLAPAIGLCVLDAAMASGTGQIVAVDVDWPTFLDASGAASPLISKYANLRASPMPLDRSSAVPGFLEQLQVASPGERRKLLRAQVQTDLMK